MLLEPRKVVVVVLRLGICKCYNRPVFKFGTTYVIKVLSFNERPCTLKMKSRQAKLSACVDFGFRGITVFVHRIGADALVWSRVVRKATS